MTDKPYWTHRQLAGRVMAAYLVGVIVGSVFTWRSIELWAPEPPVAAQVSAGIEEAAKQLVKEQFYHE